MAPGDGFEAMRSLWEGLAGRYAAYRLALPGDPTFHCQAELCDAHCCRAMHVSLGEGEANRLEAAGWAPLEFLECEDGEPIALPLVQPYILARKDGQCALLDEALRCRAYTARPDACRLYPHQVLFVDAESGRMLHPERSAARAAVAASLRGRPDGNCAALLLRHVECPGFTGAPMGAGAWRDLFIATYRLQHDDPRPRRSDQGEVVSSPP